MIEGLNDDRRKIDNSTVLFFFNKINQLKRFNTLWKCRVLVNFEKMQKTELNWRAENSGDHVIQVRN